MAEGSKGKSEGVQGKAMSVLLGDLPPIAAETVAKDEPPCNWLEPLEEDYEEEGEEGVESDRSSEQSGRRATDALRKGRRHYVDWDQNWLDCPDLGQGWKRKEVFRRSGSTMGKMDTYYMSPKGHRFRSKIELAKHVTIDLTHFDYRQGMFVDGIVTNKRRRTDAPEDCARSSLSSSRTATPDPEAIRTPDRFTTTSPTVPRSKVSTPQRPQLTPHLPASAESAPLPRNECFGSPPRLTRVSLSSPQSADVQCSSRSPSLRPGKLSPQTLSLVTTSGKGEITSLPQSWLQSSLSPVSPPRTPETKTPMRPFGPNAVKRSPDFHLPPTTRLALDPDMTFNGGKPRQGPPPLNGCANCGSDFPGMGRGQDSLCLKCRQKKTPPPHIVFRKVGQDKWVLGKSRMEDSLTKKISPLGKKNHHSSKSLRLMSKPEFGFKAFKKVIPQDSDDDCLIPDAIDDDESGPKRRNRRMCGQCTACLRNDDCGRCDFCRDKPKFGGRNKKRQKCRLRQCQFQSRHQNRHSRQLTLMGKPEDASRIFRKRSRPPGKRTIKWRSWDEDFTDDEDEEEEEEDEDMLQRRVEAQSGGRRWMYNLEREEMAEPEIEDEGPGDLEQDFMECEDGSKELYESEELYSNYSVSAQSGAVLTSSGDQNGMVSPQPRPQELFYTMAGLSEGPRVLGTVRLTSGALQLDNVPGRIDPLPAADVLSAADPLQLSELLSRSGLELIRVETAMPQLLPVSEQAPQQEMEMAPGPQAHPEPLEAVPVITQIYSLADSTQSETVRDPGLLELLAALRHTVLPAHWVGVMAKGPLLQLFQCSKLSPMADTVLQIETGFFYQITVQSQPLLPTHAIYERHPARLAAVDQVVALLLDLEGLAVCQGFRSFEACPARGPLLCARAALCELLVPQDDEFCTKCQPPAED